MNKLNEKAKQLILDNKKVSILLYSSTGMGTRYILWEMINSLYENPQNPRDQLSVLLNEPIVIEYICSSKFLQSQVENQINSKVQQFLKKYISIKYSPVSKLGNLVASSKADLIILDEVHRTSFDLMTLLQSQRQNTKGTGIIVIEGNSSNIVQGFDYVIKLPQPNRHIFE